MQFSTLVELFRNRSESQGEALAYTFLKDGEVEKDAWTYADLDLRGRSIAATLQHLAERGDRALLMYPPGLDFIAGFLGCLYSGIVAVPAYAPSPIGSERHMRRLSAIAERAGATRILTCSEQVDRIRALAKDFLPLSRASIIATDTLEESLSSDWEETYPERDSLALLQFTSGSTALPKGVMVGHDNLMSNVRFVHECEANDAGCVSVSWLPAFHDMGLVEGILTPAYGGFPAYLMSPLAFVQRPGRWLRAITRYRATNSGGPNFAYQYCTQSVTAAQCEDLDLSAWRTAYNGSEPVRKETMQRFNAAFHACGFRPEAFCPVYGLAESTALVSASSIADEPVIRSSKRMLAGGSGSTREDNQDSGRTLVGCGEIDGRAAVRIVNPESKSLCPPDVEGEIWLAGPSIAKGYWEDPEETARVFEGFIAVTGEGPFLRTGDLGLISNAQLFVTGRIKDVMITRGRKLYPQDIEFSVTSVNPLIRHHGVAAFSVDDGVSETIVVIAELDSRRLRKIDHDVAEGVGPAKSPEYLQGIAGDIVETVARDYEVRLADVLLVPQGQIPKTSSGKIQRLSCREKYTSGQIDVLYRLSVGMRGLDSAAGKSTA